MNQQGVERTPNPFDRFTKVARIVAVVVVVDVPLLIVAGHISDALTYVFIGVFLAGWAVLFFGTFGLMALEGIRAYAKLRRASPAEFPREGFVPASSPKEAPRDLSPDLRDTERCTVDQEGEQTPEPLLRRDKVAKVAFVVGMVDFFLLIVADQISDALTNVFIGVFLACWAVLFFGPMGTLAADKIREVAKRRRAGSKEGPRHLSPDRPYTERDQPNAP